VIKRGLLGFRFKLHQSKPCRHSASYLGRILADADLFIACLDGEYGYVLDLEEEVLEFWDIPRKEVCTSLPLKTVSRCAGDILACERAV